VQVVVGLVDEGLEELAAGDEEEASRNGMLSI
jgi:hypothetical protein